MPKITKIIILALAFGLGTVLMSSCTLFKPPTIADPEKTCCQECLEFIIQTPGAENCLANPEISKQCHEFFTKNPTKDEECREGKIIASSDVVIPGKERQDEETAQYYEFKKKYENKKWRGTIQGESTTTMGNAGSCKQTYTARINEMRFIFNGPPSSPDLLRKGELLSSIEIGGKAVLESSHISCTCGQLNVEISSFPFNLAGGISLSDKIINFGVADPEADKEFKVRYVTTCGEPDSFYGDNEPLWNLFKPSLSVLKFEGDKMILAAAAESTSIINSNSNFKINGELVTF